MSGDALIKKKNKALYFFLVNQVLQYLQHTLINKSILASKNFHDLIDDISCQILIFFPSLWCYPVLRKDISIAPQLCGFCLALNVMDSECTFTTGVQICILNFDIKII